MAPGVGQPGVVSGSPVRRRSAVDLALPLDEQPGRRLRERLRGALVDSVVTGRLDAGQLVPSSRALAAQLRIGRGTVVEVYAQLIAEGYLETRPGGGTWVAAWPGGPAPDPRGRLRRLADRVRSAEPVDLRPGVGDLSAFPRDAWLSAMRSVSREVPHRQLGLPPPAGVGALREEVASYLRRTRGSAAIHADDVLIVAGVTQGVALLATVAHRRGASHVAVELPGDPVRRRQLTRLGLQTVDLPVDADGADVDVLAGSGADAVLLAPAHQFPLGVRLSDTRRSQVLRWANDCDGLIVEDDRGAELTYGQPASFCLHRDDPNRVALLGSVSATLAPGLRLGWLVPPAALHADLVQAKRDADAGSPVLEQHALARLLRHGMYERHLRMLRQRYRMRHDALLDALAMYLPDWRPFTAAAAGLTLSVRLPEHIDETALVVAARTAGVMLTGLGVYRGDQPGPPGVVLDFAAQGSRMLTDGVRRLQTITATNNGGRRSPSS